MRKLFAVALLALIIPLAGCAALGIPTADTFNEKMAAGYTTVTTIRQTSTTLMTEKKMSADDGQNVLNQADNARAGLDITRKLSGTDPKGADAKLTSIRTILTGIQAYLATKK